MVLNEILYKDGVETGNITYKDVNTIDITHNPVFWKPDNQTLQEIEEEWNKNPGRYEGLVLRAKKIEYNSQERALNIDTELTTYKEDITTRGNPDIDKRGNSLNVGAHILTEDSEFVYGVRRNKPVIIGGGLHPILDKRKRKGEFKIDSKLGFYREFWEETGNSPFNITSIKPLHIVQIPDDRNPLIMYLAETELTNREMEEIFNTYSEVCEQQGNYLELQRLSFLEANPKSFETSDFLFPKDKVEITYLSRYMDESL